MRTVTNLFIFNLCMADLINTIFNSTFNYIFMKNKYDIDVTGLLKQHFTFRDWIFGAYFCRVTNFMTHMSIVAGVLTMAAIAMERYLTIARPRSPHLSIQVCHHLQGVPKLFRYLGEKMILVTGQCNKTVF